MPELPEVETIKNQLSKVIIGKKIAELEISLPKWKQRVGPHLSKIKGAKIKAIRRRGKILIFDLDNKHSLIVHLKLTGQLIYQGKGERVAGGHPVPPLNRPVPNPTTHAIFHFSDGASLYFNDLRQFGYLEIIPTAAVEEFRAIKEFGPDPFSKEFSLEWFKESLAKKSRTKIKPLLMDQTFISGVGNIYSDEALYEAKIMPTRTAGSLSDSEIKDLYHAVQHVLELGLKSGGASDNTYVNTKGEQGSFMKHAKVYHCDKDAKGHSVKKMKFGGRSVHYCPICQR